ncbi:MAG: SMP-30/gluconolactonase/LRE family protein [Williamsia sp.]|nr:SMP-30/gluconolactonase/LRE family protein [Williamsia sp.]
MIQTRLSAKKLVSRYCFSFFLLVSFTSVSAQETKPEIGTIEAVSSEFSKLIKKDAKVEVVAEGFQFTEGALWLEREQMLLVSDIPANTIYKWTAAKGKEVYLKPAGYTDTAKRGGFLGSNAMRLSRDGKLLICQHGDRRIAMMDAPVDAPKPNFVTVAGAYNGKRLNSPNDLFVTAAGDIYFTDPSYGFERGNRDPRKELSYQGVYRVDRSGNIALLVDSIEQPNGIGVLPDGKTLLVANSDNRKKRWYAYDIAPDGSLQNARLFYDASNEKGVGGCDSFKIDKNGNVFAAGPGGLWIFSKAGKLLGRIKVDGRSVTNCALTPDGKTIFITAETYLLRVKMQ